MARIMLVDDEPEIRYITRRMLERAGHSVVEAGDGEECLRKLKEEEVDIILLDVMMPGIKGWEVCRRIKADERTRRIPVVMFTVRTSESDVEESKKSGADAHINKPFDMKELLEVIERVLGDR
ncbi:MAG: response regulator [Euryarchaeota archaeon]|nr:response regulator [Euryarchaeota archaeon]